MKSFLTISLALLVLLQSFSRMWIVMDYQANKDFIAKVLCINKDKPKLKCEGKCYLTKQLKKEEQKEKQNPEKTGAKYEVYLTASSFVLQHAFAAVQPVSYPSFEINYAGSRLIDIFHPPRHQA